MSSFEYPVMGRLLRRGKSLVPFFERLLAGARSADYWGIILLIDNFHALPNEHAREVCRRFKVLKEQRTLNRLGMILTSARSFAPLRAQGDSPFDAYTALSTTGSESEDCGLHKLISQGMRRESEAATELDWLMHRAHELDGLHWMLLHIASSERVRKIARSLLEADTCPMASMEPDFDLVEETGLFVGDRETHRYKFRHTVLRNAARRALEILEGSDNQSDTKDGSIAGALLTFNAHARCLSRHPQLVECLPPLQELWKQTICPDPAELWAHARPAGGGTTGAWLRVTRNRTTVHRGGSAPELCIHALTRSRGRDQSSVVARDLHQASCLAQVRQRRCRPGRCAIES